MATRGKPSTPRPGYTLVEVIVVIAILGILITLLLGAIQAARESARLTHCKNNLKQIGLAMQGHVGAYGRYPSNGWGHAWVGEPDRGTGREQPGGWIYNLLAFLEQPALRELGRGLGPPEKRQALTRLIQVPLPVLVCPTRPSPTLSPAAPYWTLRNADPAPLIPKTHYAVNGGDCFSPSAIWEGPLTLQQGDANQYAWTDLTQFTGICYQRSEIQPAMIRDGLSQTYLIGEKYVSQPNYATYLDEGYNQGLYIGTCLDLVRWVAQVPRRDDDSTDVQRFGSAHSAGCQFVFCDGAVRLISYQIDPEVHRRLGNRRDGLPVSTGSY